VTAAGYTLLPAVYDRWQATYGKDYSTLILPRLLRTFRTYGIPATRLLDVACGTGTLALLLRPYGWRVWAVDGSEGMVRRARAKCAPHRSVISVGRQDMRSLKLKERVDVCTCLFDSLNHMLTVRDVESTLAGIARVLNPGGWFIFDVTNGAGYRTLWRGVQTIEHPDFTLRLRNRYSPSTRIARSEVFLRWQGLAGRADGHETVTERCYPPSVLRASLRKHGFTVRESIDFNFTGVPGLGKLKTWWVARKTDGQWSVND